MSTVHVSFKDRESRAKARWLISFSNQEGFSRYIGNLPPRDLVIDIKALRVLDEAGIKVYPPASDGKKPLYKEPLNVAEVLASFNPE